MTRLRRFPCGEADYLTEQGINLKTAQQYPLRFGPSAIRELVEAGITPEQAELAPPNLNASQIIAQQEETA